MADCFPPEADDLHRRWLPREIFADTGIVDTEAGIIGVEELAAQLAGILGGRAKDPRCTRLLLRGRYRQQPSRVLSTPPRRRHRHHILLATAASSSSPLARPNLGSA
ncbi:unnamed protein product [Urochloa humidicola]